VTESQATSFIPYT